MKIYTRGGDRGETSLLSGGRVRKDDRRIEAYGTVDELNSSIGLVRATWRDSALDGQLELIQRDLFEIGALLATAEPDPRFQGASQQRIEELEREIDRMESELKPLTAFILPGGTPEAAQLHIARTVCRRAERLVVAVDSNELVMRSIAYLNRLSDYLFVAARFANHQHGVSDTLWMRGQV